MMTIHVLIYTIHKCAWVSAYTQMLWMPELLTLSLARFMFLMP